MTCRTGSIAGSAISRSRSDVLVASAGVAHAPLVLAKRLGQKRGLRPHPRRRAVDVLRSEALANQLLEPVDLLRLAAEMIVEAEHLGDEARAELKRQLAAGRRRGARGRLRDDVASTGARRRGGFASRA